MSHPYTDPFHSGQAQFTPTFQLTNRDMLRRRGGGGMPGDSGGAASPLSGLGGMVGDVLQAAGYGQQEPSRAPVVSDADPPSQGVHTDDQGDLYHTRSNGDGTTTTTHIASDGAQDGD